MQLFFEGCKSKTIIEDSKIFSILTCLCYDKILGLNYIYIYIYIYIYRNRACNYHFSV